MMTSSFERKSSTQQSGTSKPIFIFGSARSLGNTRKFLNLVLETRPHPVVDLNELNITPYDYDHKNKDDDYIPLMEKALKDHDTLVLVTPVYWYGTSDIMKIFINRLTDLHYLRKDLREKLKGKKVFVISSFGSKSPPKGFEEVFQQICGYFEMDYLGSIFFYSGSDPKLQEMNEASLKKAQDILFRTLE